MDPRDYQRFGKAVEKDPDDHSCTLIYGCQVFEFWFTAAANKEDAKELAQVNGRRVDIYADKNSSDDAVECTLDIFQILMLALIAHLKPLNNHRIYEESFTIHAEIGIFHVTHVTRHAATEAMADVLLQTTPAIFPDKSAARLMIIPALIHHNLLPTLNEAS
jgi:hypothetical protein